MQSGNRTRGPKWSYDETLATFGLYMMLNQRQRNDKNNPHIAQLAVGLNRTASSVYMKLMNLRAHDPNEHARGVSGLAHSGKLEIQIWKEYQEQSDKLLILALNVYVSFIEKVPLPTQDARNRRTMHSSPTPQKSLVEETTSLLLMLQDRPSSRGNSRLQLHSDLNMRQQHYRGSIKATFAML